MSTVTCDLCKIKGTNKEISVWPSDIDWCKDTEACMQRVFDKMWNDTSDGCCSQLRDFCQFYGTNALIRLIKAKTNIPKNDFPNAIDEWLS